MTQQSTRRQGPGSTAILAIILISQSMILLDTSIMVTALPKIHNTNGRHPSWTS